MKRAATGWPTKGLKTRVHPARGYIRIPCPKGRDLIVRAPMSGWQQRRRKANAEACMTGYQAKANRIFGKRPGTHIAVCCPSERFAEVYGDR